MRLQPRKSTLSSQMAAALFVALALLIVMAVSIGAWAINRVDDNARDRQQRFIASTLHKQLLGLAEEQQGVSIWDDAVVHANSGDQTWLAENVGVWMNAYFGHDQAFILDRQNQPVHAMIDGNTVAPESFAAERGAVLPLVEKLRAAMAVVTVTGEESTAAVSHLSAADVIDLGTQIALVSVVPIVPSTDRVQQLAGDENLHVAVKYADMGLVDRVASIFELQEATISRTAEDDYWRSSVALSDSAGTALAFLSWTRYRPGFQLFREILPMLAFSLAIGVGLVGFLVRRLVRASANLQASEAHAHFLAFHDSLSGMPNRAMFEARMGEVLVAMPDTGGHVALLYIDLDGFKHINDTFGHGAGDELVREVGARIGLIAHEAAVVARIGGDEFAVILADVASPEAIIAVCDRLHEAISRPYELLGNEAHVTASIGVASAIRREDGDDLVRKADIALYQAKQAGKDRYAIFEPAMDELIKQRRLVEVDLRIALTLGGQLRLAYQPLFSGRDGSLLGAEALARWDHPRRGRLSPDIFIPIAEESGLIHELGLWALNEACAFASAVNLPKIAVNVSPIQLRDKIFPDEVIAVLRHFRLDPSRLELELTEKVMIDADAVTNAALHKLRKAGVCISLDDFGTGKSVFKYVRDYGVDKLKIDRSFVNRLGADEAANTLVRSVVDLAKAMGLRVTAEGVETPLQRTILEAMGCDELQGYLLSRPITPEQLTTLVAAANLSAARRKIA